MNYFERNPSLAIPKRSIIPRYLVLVPTRCPSELSVAIPDPHVPHRAPQVKYHQFFPPFHVQTFPPQQEEKTQPTMTVGPPSRCIGFKAVDWL